MDQSKKHKLLTVAEVVLFAWAMGEIGAFYFRDSISPVMLTLFRALPFVVLTTGMLGFIWAFLEHKHAKPILLISMVIVSVLVLIIIYFL